MRIPLAIVAVVLVLLTIALGRYGQPEAPSRATAAPRYHLASAPPAPVSAPRLFDLETRRDFHAELEDDMGVEYASCSPWHDALGRWMIAARWRSIQGSDGRPEQPACGLAFYWMPEGRLIHRIVCDPVPSSPPCWLPGTAARLVFVAGHCSLYRLDLETPTGLPVDNKGRAFEPRSVEWCCPLPSDEPLMLSDPSCPTWLPGGPWLLVSSIYPEPDDPPLGPMKCHALWLRLSEDADCVTAAGSIFARTPESPPEAQRAIRFLRLAEDGDGRLYLAYLFHGAALGRWELRLAPARLDPTTGAPQADAAASRVLSADCLAIPPFFSADARWIYAAVAQPEPRHEPGCSDGRDRGAEPELLRFSNPWAGQPAGTSIACSKPCPPERRPHGRCRTRNGATH